MYQEQLQFYAREFIGEWDYDFAELIEVASLEDIKEHKQVIMQELKEVLKMMVIQFEEGLSDIDDVTHVSDTIKWVNSL